ncbi:putative beta-fructofuranosidase [Aspergillus campestris IBT 28561]|uniref:Beta-fructofuranosidase n=1 Tax=Aspergillus campestris (strain IBT 28561) TaxID=1392248 RepID=A0A2I1D5G6_ASPC2|nr:putative beta-fructofuranosidase [Aspergillus campestris IBT 28561]PKY05115.1 putative beta-fructofuranosidase [Aspergillus campestris IBT 28561]
MRISPWIMCFVAAAQAADYTGPLRPQVHFSPPVNFMNDPNGLFYDDRSGTYHLYYQYNPSEPVAGNQHWGHATSPDLYHWTNQPIAISPSESDEYIFSGSAVVDADNTSGFFPDQEDGVVAIYTVDAPDKETQHIAYSTDGGYTFTKYADNPVIDSTSKDFRDPQVTWHHGTQRWVMVIAYAADRVIGFYTSSNLREWEHASNFTQAGLPGVEFECPNLVEFPVNQALAHKGKKHVLFISVNPGAPLGGSGTFYVVGDFNGTHFESETPHAPLYDFAKDNYAAQWFSGIPAGQPPVSIGWASNWDYTEEVPTGKREGWRSAATLPRTHTLTQVDGSWVVTHSPADGLAPVRGAQLGSWDLQSGDNGTTVDFSHVSSKAVYLEVAIEEINPLSPVGEVVFRISSSTSGESLDGGLRLNQNRFWISRAGTHLFTSQDNGNYTSEFHTAVSVETSSFRFSAVVDHSVFEVFVEDGSRSGTMSFFPTSPLDILDVSARGLEAGSRVSVDVWGLRGVWE